MAALARTHGGGAGNDTYVVDNAGDIVNESLPARRDRHRAVLDQLQPGRYRARLGAVENLTLLGTGNINGTGNALDNVLTGNAGANVA